jgi:hypothetical protein
MKQRMLSDRGVEFNPPLATAHSIQPRSYGIVAESFRLAIH